MYEIANVEPYEQPTMEGEENPDTEQHWQFDIISRMKVEEYLKKYKQETEIQQEINDEAFVALDSDICNIYDIIEGGSE